MTPPEPNATAHPHSSDAPISRRRYQRIRVQISTLACFVFIERGGAEAAIISISGDRKRRETDVGGWMGFGSLGYVISGYGGSLGLEVAAHTLREARISFLVVISL